MAFARGDKLNYHSAKHIIETVRLQLRISPNVSRLAVPAGGKITGTLRGVCYTMLRSL